MTEAQGALFGGQTPYQEYQRQIHEDVPDTPMEPGGQSRTRAEGIAVKVRALLPEMIGKANAIKSSEIMLEIGEEPTPTNQPLRAAMKILMLEEGVAVMGSAAGFYVAQTEDEWLEIRASLISRLNGIARDVAGWDRVRGKVVALSRQKGGE